MDPQTIIMRISECIDDLGLLLDQIYKFPQKQREQYFERIQGMKNKLLIMKGNLRQSNTSSIQKQYKQIYIAMNALKNQIHQQTALNTSTKQNREVHRVKDQKQLRKSYEDAMKLILQKDQDILILNRLLLEKQQLIKMNYDELKRIKSQYDILMEGNRLSKYDQTSYEIDLQGTRVALMRADQQIMDMQIRQQEKDKIFNSAIVELERLKVQLIAANEKICHYEQIAETSMKKTRLAEENAKKIQREAQGLNQNYRIKDSNNFKKLRQIGDLQLELTIKLDLVRQLEQQNKRLKEDLQVLQTELIKHKNIISQNKEQVTIQKEKMRQQQRDLQRSIQNGHMRETELKRQIEDSEKRYLIVISKLNSAEQFRTKYNESQCKNEIYIDKINKLQLCIDKYQNQIKTLLKQKEKISEQLQTQTSKVRQYQVQVFKLRQKIKMKEEEKEKLSEDRQNYYNKYREYQRALSMHEIQQKSIQEETQGEKSKLFQFQQKYKSKQKQIEGLKIRLLRAKIETIHNIREVIN